MTAEVNSSAIRVLHWNDGELQIEFTNGTKYSYSGVPEDVYQDLTEASSTGTYFNAYVRPLYSGRRSG